MDTCSLSTYGVGKRGVACGLRKVCRRILYAGRNTAILTFTYVNSINHGSLSEKFHKKRTICVPSSARTRSFPVLYMLDTDTLVVAPIIFFVVFFPKH